MNGRTDDSFRVAELEKAIRLILPLAEHAARETPVQQSSDWEAIANAKAVLAGVLATDPESSGGGSWIATPCRSS